MHSRCLDAVVLPVTGGGARCAPGRTQGVEPRLAGVLARIEAAFDVVFGMGHNPLRQLGALGFWFLWTAIVTGIYLYAGFDTRADGAYASVTRLTQSAWPASGVARSVHRYASDALVLVVVLHLVREWLRGRYAHWHRFAWLTGVAALVMAYCAGLTGFWLVWDRLAQYSLRATMEWLDALPVFGELGRNFIVNAAVTDRLFSLLVFVHIGVPLALLAGLWLHVQRLARPGTQPPRILAWLTLAALVVLALMAPVQSQGPADLAASPTTLQVDWFYLGMHAVADRTSQAALWTMAIAGLLVVSLLPWRGRAARVARAPAAVVDEAHCNGCGRCAADCPYAAITITRPVSEGGAHDAPPRAVVAAELCAACGICAGACPSSTPFRSADLLTGIDLPHRRIAAVRADVDEILARWRGRTHAAAPILVLGCEGTLHADLQQLGGSGVVGLELVCAGQLPPSFIPYALRTGARGVVVSACVDCTYRLGELWTAQRLQGRREPRLRDGVLEYVREVCRAPGDVRQLAAALASLRAELESHGSAVAGLPPKRIVDEDAHVA